MASTEKIQKALEEAELIRSVLYDKHGYGILVPDREVKLCAIRMERLLYKYGVSIFEYIAALNEMPNNEKKMDRTDLAG